MTDIKSKKVVQTQPFANWLDNLADQVAKAAILERIDRLKKGLLGNAKLLTNAPGVHELIIDIGPGYRVYFHRAGDTIVLLLLGGDKSTQKSDIKKAAKMVADMVAQQAAARKKRQDGEKAAVKAATKNSGSKAKSKRK